MRRLWMLLAALALTVILAVPALAAGHEHATCNYAGALCSDCNAGTHLGWTSLADVEGTTLPEGNYYVPEGGFTGSFTVSSGTVRICLNGNTWQGSGQRTLTVEGGATVKIVDCSEVLEAGGYVTKGVMKGVQLWTSASGDTSQKDSNSTVIGGTISVSHGSVYFYNGTITGGTAINGGNVALWGTSATQKAYFYLEGGQILGAGYSNYISTSTSKATTVNSLVGGGIANNRGGNVYVRGYAEFHMGNDDTALIGGGCAIPVISGGNTLCGQGGNVSVSSTSNGSGSFHIKSGVLKDSFGTDAGGNFHLEYGTVNMSGGMITGGRYRNQSAAINANVFQNTGTFAISGGEITGGYLALNYNVANDAKTVVKLSGTAKITGVGLTLQYSATGTNNYKGIPVLRVGDFEPGADIVVAVKDTAYFTNDETLPKDTLLVKDTSSDSVKNFMVDDMTGDGKITWADYEDATRYIRGKTGNCLLTYEEDGIYLRSEKDTMYHCVCCNSLPTRYNRAGKIVHADNCDAYDHLWQPYAIGDNTVLPGATTGGDASKIKEEPGYYYLKENDAVETGASGPDGKVQWTSAQNNFLAEGHWYIDFNGLTVEANRRYISVHYDVDTDVTLTNSAATGGIVWSGTVSDHSALWMRRTAATDANSMNKQLNVYNLTLDASKFSLTKKLIAMNTGTAYFYNCTIAGATLTATDGAGGAIYGENGSNIKLDGCDVTGGKAVTNGGAICFESTGNLTIANTTISGGTAVNGGNLYVKNGKATLSGSTIGGGVAYAGGTMTLSGEMRVSNPGNGLASGILIAAGKKLTFQNLSDTSDIVICMESATAGTELSNAVEGLNEYCFSLVGSDLYLAVENGVLKITDLAPEDAKLIHNGKRMNTWPTEIGDNDYIKLFGNMDGANVSANFILDLNGYNLTGVTVQEGKKVRLFDSSASNYDVPTGSVTLAEGQTNPFVREFLTGSIIDRNLRYVTICVDGKYSAHRIYLSVRSAVLYPRLSGDQAAVGYRIALRCDEQVAEQVEFGLQVAGDGEPIFVASKSAIVGQGSSNDNSRVIGITYNPATITSTKAEGVLSGSAALRFKVGGDVIVSGVAKTSLKELTEASYLKYHGLSASVQEKLGWMKTTYAGVMTNWDTKIKVSKEGYEALEGKKVLFIGNSYTYWGHCTINVSANIRDQASRTGDKGLFYQLCKENGLDVEVTTWVFGAHDITDSMGTACTYCSDRVNHLSYLVDPYFDYVFMQPFVEAEYAGDIVTHLTPIMDFFKKANPNVKFFFNAAHGRPDINFKWKAELGALPAAGVTVCNWGGVIDDIVKKVVEVPGATQTYGRSTFVISKSDGDGHHQNILAGYMTALMAYCAITGDSAVGQPYDFVDDPTINPNFGLEAFKEKNYTYIPPDATANKFWKEDGFVETNFVEVMRSPSDMNGIQQLIDQYLDAFNP